MTVRGAAHAGRFYLADGDRLAAQVACWLMEMPALPKTPRAIIVPHAGYQYSGSIAATGYAQIKPLAQQIHTVVILSPNHRVAVTGVVAPSCHAFATPLGQVLVNVDIVAKLVATKGVTINDQAHKLEHAIEVQLPFLQLSLDKFDIVPLIVGDISAEALAELILPFWRDPASVLIVSSDLSHYSPLAEAIDHDKETIQRLQDLASDLVGEDACGFRAINGLMHLLCQEGGSVRLLEYGNSADASGDKSRVVGYGSFAVYPDT